MSIAPFETDDVSVLRDIPYLGPERAEKMDAYLPAKRFARPVPFILLIHGGGWRINDKADTRERNIGQNLAAAGYAVFSINYLLNVGEKDPVTGKIELTQVAWPRNFYDCKTALRFLRHEAARFGIDPQRVGVMGGSAGGHLAMLVGATQEHEEFNREGEYREQSNAVNCIINFYGVADVRGERDPVFGGSEAAHAASPVNYFTPDLPPMLIAHGTADRIVPVEESRKLAKMLEELGTDYWYLEIAGAPHTFHLQPEAMDLRPVVLTFLEKHLGPGTVIP